MDEMADVPESVRESESSEPGAGRTICINCYEDGTYDVFESQFQPASERDQPNGIHGLESIEEALKAVIALKRQGKDYSAAEEDAMLGAYGSPAEPTQEY